MRLGWGVGPRNEARLGSGAWEQGYTPPSERTSHSVLTSFKAFILPLKEEICNSLQHDKNNHMLTHTNTVHCK